MVPLGPLGPCVGRISCLLDALRVPDDELEAALDACKAKRYGTTEVELKYHGAAPAQRSCSEVEGVTQGLERLKRR